MTAFDIYSAIGGVNEDILEESEIMPKKKNTKIIPLMAAAACFAVVAVGLSHTFRSDDIEQPVTDMTIGSTVAEINIQTSPYETGEESSPTTGDGFTVSENTDPNAPTETAEMHTETSPVVEEETTANCTTSRDEEESKMPAPFGTLAESGGDENAGYYQPCNFILDNIPVELLKLRDGDKVNQWLEKDKLSSRQSVPSSIKDYVNIYSFITDFNITKEEAETALEYYLNTPEEFEHIEYRDLDIIYSGDIELITKTYASEYSIVVGDKIYSPEWVYTHSAEDYKAAGITAEDILSKVDNYSSILFTDEARLAFSEKLSAYTGEQVVIKAVEFQEKKEAYDIQDDVPEDVADDVYDEVVDVPEEYE